MRFDLEDALPPGAVVLDATLRLHASKMAGGPSEVALHRVLAPWGEGPSFATGGGGATAEPGDVTWLHREYDDLPWLHAGGRFVAASSATAKVASLGDATWSGGAKLVADVRLWQQAPKQNHGWLLRGDESAPTTSIGLDTREHGEPTQRPRLEVTYRVAGR